MYAEIEWNEGTIEVKYTQEPIIPAQITGRDRDHPEEGGEVEVQAVMLDGFDIKDELTEEEWEYITDKLEYYND